MKIKKKILLSFFFFWGGGGRAGVGGSDQAVGWGRGVARFGVGR